MKSSWFQKCKTQKDKASVKQAILSQREPLDRLKEILEPMLVLEPERQLEVLVRPYQIR